MADKKRILFVDDEKNVLDGLRRMLRSMRAEWDMAFASGSEEALEILGQKRFDVIVSDMRMPGLSGEQLLAVVRQRYPAIVRLVLSGQADKDSILKSVGPIHQFLQKPCDAETLTLTISRTMELGDLFANEKLKAIVTALESLPSLPSHQEELMAQLQTTDVSPKLVGETIGKDLAMSAKILQLVNSAFFGLRRHVAIPADAVVLLGLDTIRSLVLTMQVFSQVAKGDIKGFSQDALLAHSAAVAAVAKKIAAAQGMEPAASEEAYMAGLLHDVGKLVFASELPEEYAEAGAVAVRDGISCEEAERQVIGASHGEIGGYLLGLWAFKAPVVDAAVFHHCPGRHRSEGLTTVTAVHVANAIVHQDLNAEDTTGLDVDQEYLDRIGVGDRLAAWQDKYKCAA